MGAIESLTLEKIRWIAGSEFNETDALNSATTPYSASLEGAIAVALQKHGDKLTPEEPRRSYYTKRDGTWGNFDPLTKTFTPDIDG